MGLDSGLPQDFWALVLTTFLFNLGASLFFFLYNLLMLDLGYREASLGAFASAMAAGSVAGTLPTWLLVRRVGITRGLIGCLLAMAGALLARAFLSWYFPQLIFAFLYGVSLCGWVVCLSPAVAAAVDEQRRPTAFSILFAVAVATASLGGVLGGHIPGWCQHVCVQWLGMALSGIAAKRVTLAFAVLFTALAAVPLTALPWKRPPVASTWIPRPTRPMMRFLAASACWATALGAFNPFANVFFLRHLGMQMAHLGNFFSVAQLIQAGAVLLVPLLIRKTGLLRAILAGQMASAMALAVLASSRTPRSGELVFTAFLASQHMCEPAMQTLLMNIVGENERGGAATINFLTISAAQAGAAALAGPAFARVGYPLVLLGISLVALGAAIAFQLLFASYSAEVSGFLESGS